MFNEINTKDFSFKTDLQRTLTDNISNPWPPQFMTKLSSDIAQQLLSGNVF